MHVQNRQLSIVIVQLGDPLFSWNTEMPKYLIQHYKVVKHLILVEVTVWEKRHCIVRLPF